MLYVDCSVKRQTSWGCLRFVIVVFPDHTLLLFCSKMVNFLFSACFGSRFCYHSNSKSQTNTRLIHLGHCPIFLSPFHSLHLFQQFQADSVYKKSLEDACYFLLQSDSLVFYSFSLFRYTCFSSFRQIVSIKNLLKMLVTSCYSLFH